MRRRVTRRENDGSLTVLAERCEGMRFNQPNDLTIDSRGRIYFSDPCYGDRSRMEMLDGDGRRIEGVYRIDPDGAVTRIITHEVDRPNGLAVTPDDRYLYVDEVRGWEERHGRQLVDAIVLLRTRHGRHWEDGVRYLVTATTGPEAVADLHFPSLSPAAAQWLVEHRAIKAIGIDTPSIDHGQSSRFQSHVTLFEHNISAFENVANLEELPESGSTVIALPMKIGGGSGAPLSIIAFVPQ